MTTSLQPVLSCSERICSDLTVFLSDGGTTYEVYIGVSLLERVGADPNNIGRKMLVGRLCNAGAAVTGLGETFGHDPRTINKWAAALRSTDIDEIARAFAGREGGRKSSPELIRYAQQLYRERHLLGRNYREIIIEKVAEVFGEGSSRSSATAVHRTDSAGSGQCRAVEDAVRPQPVELHWPRDKRHERTAKSPG